MFHKVFYFLRSFKDGDAGLINDEATLGEMEDLCDQSCISPPYEGDINAALHNDDATLGDMGSICDESCSRDVGEADTRDFHPFTASNVFGAGTQTQPSVVAEPYSMPPHGGQAETHASMEADDCDENIIFEEDEEEDERYLFGGQECDDWDADEDVDLETTNEDPNEPDVSDPYDAVYANVLDETHMLKLEDNCEHCNAKKFESEPPGFYCRSGKIHLSTPETPSELVRLWSSSDTDARHFRANIRYFNAHFSFTSLYCKLDRVTTDMKNCGIYTFHAHGQIYHNIRSFGKEDGHEPRHLELYFYDHDPSLEHRLHKCHEKSAQEDREVIQRLKDILHGINHYSENLRSMGQVHNNKVAKQHMELRFCVLACL
ncbi:uncharacterized protein LOC111255799 isoform X2 [Setaria italica]|uniref:uncharacterized protein LOC111255799 isoform X2 n=1 Tax=Setaria italica TaxID=4555 RepID=UPI000BE5068A|nr:uncharacterized protein LOC111255799 isoform X2 [Setaria italica]